MFKVEITLLSSAAFTSNAALRLHKERVKKVSQSSRFSKTQNFYVAANNGHTSRRCKYPVHPNKLNIVQPKIEDKKNCFRNQQGFLPIPCKIQRITSSLLNKTIKSTRKHKAIH